MGKQAQQKKILKMQIKKHLKILIFFVQKF